MITDLGKILRKIRIDNNEIMKDMSQKLNMTASYLSLIEQGKRKTPDKLIDKLKENYELSDAIINELNQSINSHSIVGVVAEKLEIGDVVYISDNKIYKYDGKIKNIVHVSNANIYKESDNY